jgi:hypothetical protein
MLENVMLLETENDSFITTIYKYGKSRHVLADHSGHAV